MAQVQGWAFIGIMKSFLTAGVLFPDIAAKIQDMRPDEWYSFEDYMDCIARVAATLSEPVVTKVGRGVCLANAEQFKAGFPKIDDIMKNYEVLARQVVRGVDVKHVGRTYSYRAGEAVIEFSKMQPPALSKGYMMGFIAIYNLDPLDLKVIDVDHDTIHFKLTWRP